MTGPSVPGVRTPRTGVKQDRFTRVDPARGVAFEVLRAVATQDSYANLVLPKLLRDKRLGGRDAAFATELAYGVLRGRGTYDALLATLVDRPLADLDDGVLDVLRMGLHQLLAMRVPDHAAVATSVAVARTHVGGGPSGLVNAVLRKASGRDLAQWAAEVAPGDTDDDLAVRYSHPQWVVRSLREALRAHGHDPAELVDLLVADNTPAQVALAALPGLSTVDDLVGRDAHVEVGTGRWSPAAAHVVHGDPGRLAAVRAGRARVQDEGSQIVALLLAAAEVEGRDERWLDLCAGPGGKAALLAATAAGRGAELTAVEVAPHRPTSSGRRWPPSRPSRRGPSRSASGTGARSVPPNPAPTTACSSTPVHRSRSPAPSTGGPLAPHPADLGSLAPLPRECSARRSTPCGPVGSSRTPRARPCCPRRGSSSTTR